ncbi:hypothetical protein CTI12_AA381280 [Artemisia annua]|uniref:Uncharacterized protein n=1 Tax=Artemisia annua TaxID=35608 RepID=A0A2U1MFT7_ARTAN|nr:hypothetical protein CTI12_AA381280 [Artemisia annua]
MPVIKTTTATPGLSTPDDAWKYEYGDEKIKLPFIAHVVDTMRTRISHKYVNDGAAFKGLLPKSLPIPPSGPSHHHNSIGINSMQP